MLDDTCVRFEEHKDGKPGEVLRTRAMANLTERVQEGSSPTCKSEGMSYLPVRFRSVSMSERARWSLSHSGKGVSKVEGEIGRGC